MGGRRLGRRKPVGGGEADHTWSRGRSERAGDANADGQRWRQAGLAGSGWLGELGELGHLLGKEKKSREDGACKLSP